MIRDLDTIHLGQDQSNSRKWCSQIENDTFGQVGNQWIYFAKQPSIVWIVCSRYMYQLQFSSVTAIFSGQWVISIEECVCVCVHRRWADPHLHVQVNCGNGDGGYFHCIFVHFLWLMPFSCDSRFFPRAYDFRFAGIATGTTIAIATNLLIATLIHITMCTDSVQMLISFTMINALLVYCWIC